MGTSATYDASQMRAKFEAAMTIYATAKGGSIDDVFGTLFAETIDLRTVDNAGDWDMMALPDISPNSEVTVTWTDGTRYVQFTYAELNRDDFVQKRMDAILESLARTHELINGLDTLLTGVGYTIVQPVGITDSDAVWKTLVDGMQHTLVGPYTWDNGDF